MILRCSGQNNTARSYGVIPIRYEDGQLDLAMRSPLDYQTAETLRFVVNANILPVPVDPDQFDEELEVPIFNPRQA